jgi:hypothetical protein
VGQSLKNLCIAHCDQNSRNSTIKLPSSSTVQLPDGRHTSKCMKYLIFENLPFQLYFLAQLNPETKHSLPISLQLQCSHHHQYASKWFSFWTPILFIEVKAMQSWHLLICNLCITPLCHYAEIVSNKIVLYFKELHLQVEKNWYKIYCCFFQHDLESSPKSLFSLLGLDKVHLNTIQSAYSYFGKSCPTHFCCVKNCGKDFNSINAASPQQHCSNVLTPSKRWTIVCYCGLVQDTEEQDKNHSLERDFDQLPAYLSILWISKLEAVKISSVIAIWSQHSHSSVQVRRLKRTKCVVVSEWILPVHDVVLCTWPALL